MRAQDTGAMDTLVLQYSVCANDRVQLSTELRSAGRCELGSTFPRVCRYGALMEQSARLAETLAQSIEVMGACRTDDDLVLAGGHLRSLQDLGAGLRDCLLTDEVIRILERMPGITHLIFRCDPLLNGVPFDHMFLWDDFIGFRYATGKQLLLSSRRDTLLLRGVPRRPYRCSSIIDPGGLLPGVAKDDFIAFLDAWTPAESEILNFDRFSVSRRVTVGDVTRMVRSSDIVTFLCHHRYNDGAPEKSGYILDDVSGDEPKVFSAADLLESVKLGDAPPSMILSISCESGVTRGWEAGWPEDSRVYGIADAAMRVGVRHHICASLKIPASRSGKVLLPFYRALAAGRTVGHSLRQMRSALRGDSDAVRNGGTILALAFVLYGDPSDAYVSAEAPPGAPEIPLRPKLAASGGLPARAGRTRQVRPATRGESRRHERHSGPAVAGDADSPASPAQGVLPLDDGQALGRFVVLARDCASRSYDIVRPWFYIGRGNACHVALSSPGVSSLHATCAQLGADFIIVDRESTNGTYVDGSRVRQRRLQTGDAVHIDRFWLVFTLMARREAASLLYSKNGDVAPGGTARRADEDEQTECAGASRQPHQVSVVLESSGGLLVGSDSKPILIGSDPVCPLCLVGGVAPLHAAVLWDVVIDKTGRVTDAGVFVEDLGSGAGTLLNGKPVRRAKLAHSDVLTIGGHRIVVSFVGDVRQRSESLFNAAPAPGGLVLTCVRGPGGGRALSLAGERRFLIGDAAECDLSLPGEEISGRHARVDCAPAAAGGRRSLRGRRPVVTIADLASANGTFVNGKELAPKEACRIVLGDIIRLSRGKGHSDLLLHYGLE